MAQAENVETSVGLVPSRRRRLGLGYPLMAALALVFAGAFAAIAVSAIGASGLVRIVGALSFLCALGFLTLAGRAVIVSFKARRGN